MKHTTLISALRTRLSRFRKDAEGASLVELGIVLPLFLLIFLALIDFGRMAFHYVVAEKAMQVAARVAAVRPPACPGLPTTNARGPSTATPRFGTDCSAGLGICADPGTISCNSSAANPTANEIWNIVRGALPNDATHANLRFSYQFDGNLGFLGGPYVPVVTVQLQNLTFDFVSPLATLVAMSGGSASNVPAQSIPFPAFSVSLPAEDLAMGNAG